MVLGIMTRMFRRPHLEEVADAVCNSGLRSVQLNLLSAGLETLPAQLDPSSARIIGAVFASRALAVAAVSGTFNLIHPHLAYREEGIRRLNLLISRCHLLGTRVVTLCTGTRDPENMWRYHPENNDPSAWRDLVSALRPLLKVAENEDVILAIEPEIVNVIDTPAKARAIIEELGSPNLRVVMDPANLFHPSDLANMRSILQDAFQCLSLYIELAHAKDVTFPDAGGTECRRLSAGSGTLDFSLYLTLLRSAQYQGALVLHDLEESEVPLCKTRLEHLLRSLDC